MRKTCLFMCITSLLLIPVACNGQTVSVGTSYLNQTLSGEKGPNILATDFTLQLGAPDAAGMYRVRLHDDKLIWSRLEVGPKRGNVSAFYSLDSLNGIWLNGAGIRFSQSREIGRSIELMGGVYDRGFCFEGSCSVERAGFVGRIGYELRKFGDLRWWGPSVSVGWRW